MRDFLKDNPQLEVVLCSSRESELVIMVLEKESRRRISSLSISDIISGKVFDADGAFGSLFDKRVWLFKNALSKSCSGFPLISGIPGFTGEPWVHIQCENRKPMRHGLKTSPAFQ